MITRLSNLSEHLKEQGTKARLVVGAALDKNVLDAVVSAKNTGFIDVTLIGDASAIEQTLIETGNNGSDIEIIDEKSDYAAGEKAIDFIREGKAQILMNGQENYRGASVITKPLLKKNSDLIKGKTISHIAVFEMENYHKLIAVTDVAINISPDLSTKANIISNAVFLMRRFGIETPKVAVLAAVEVINERMPATMHAAILSKMAQRGQIKNCIIDGPLAFDNAISEESAIYKGIKSEVSGNVDILLAPDLETAGMLYQSLIMIAKAKVASITVGAVAPIVLTTKLDTAETRLNSILLSACTYN
ncbi:MAG: phosphate acyltransferase [Spirochaetota bacterium]